ncbi:exported protein of unknown function [Candidatus Filomicrobium marinum]|uniref:Uncharacterized protein n=1 Tax=Candidatus Filomicrobium marinum TaxID=1608628 RepID=A0A0D6J9Z5_9HYPH|nr:exported protein of unknown function [Candidatus Filomicrobium marinum]CPR15177.1 exported protein of unknown function [Candidatus Filomicrobium marinum]
MRAKSAHSNCTGVFASAIVLAAGAMRFGYSVAAVEKQAVSIRMTAYFGRKLNALCQQVMMVGAGATIVSGRRKCGGLFQQSR